MTVINPQMTPNVQPPKLCPTAVGCDMGIVHPPRLEADTFEKNTDLTRFEQLLQDVAKPMPITQDAKEPLNPPSPIPGPSISAQALDKVAAFLDALRALKEVL